MVTDNMISNNKISNDLVGIAGVHYVAYQLAMRGLIAMPTIRNTSGIDIIVTDPLTMKSANLQVKTSQKKVDFWPTSKPQKCIQGKNCFYVFIRTMPVQKIFQVFLEESEKVVSQVTKNVDDQIKRGRQPFPCWYLPKEKQKQDLLESKWKQWRPIT